MTPEELVEKVEAAMYEVDGYYVSKDQARAAIAVALEEAVDAVHEVGDHAAAEAYARAIYALMSPSLDTKQDNAA